MEKLFDIKNKVAVITGAAGVLCGTMARAMAQRGAKVAILDLNIKAAEQLVDEIKANGGVAVATECNVLDKASLENAQKLVAEKLGTVDILINGAGGNKKQASTSDELSFFDMPADAVRFVFDLNFLGTLLTCQVFGKDMARVGEGVIINISSMNAFTPLTRIPAYSAAKAAISNFTQWLAVHMCQNYSTKIRVNAIAPGFFLTEQNRFLLTDEQTGKPTERGQKIIDNTPMGRYGKPDELVGTLLWLVGDGAEFITGIVVPVDGGFSAFSGV